MIAVEHAGLFVDRLGDALRPNPVVAAVLGATWAAGLTPDEIAPAQLDMFGRFRMIVNDREVRFARRREAQIVQYLALQPHGRATRAELLDVFWKDGDRQLAAQGLRTALSAIRGAIARCSGADAVERYFVTDRRNGGAALRSRHQLRPPLRIARQPRAGRRGPRRRSPGRTALERGATMYPRHAAARAASPRRRWIEPMAAQYAVLAELARARGVPRRLAASPFGRLKQPPALSRRCSAADSPLQGCVRR